MENKSDKSSKLNEGIANFVVVNDENDTVSAFQNVICRPADFKTNRIHSPAKSAYSEPSDCDITSYQVNQSVSKRTLSHSEDDANDVKLSFSPVFSPVVTVAYQQFRPPSIHTLGTIAKRRSVNGLTKSSVKSKKQDISTYPEYSKQCNFLENLQMLDEDISWVSSMATPAPDVPASQFNTIERATFLPEEKFQNIQPRALFSPTSDDNCGCSPLPMSSDSEGEVAYKSKARLSDVCATLNQLEFKSLENEGNKFVENNIISQPNITSKADAYYPTSPVFSIRPKKSLPRKRKEIHTIRSPDFKSKQEFCSSKMKFEEDISHQDVSSGEILTNPSEISADKDYEPLLDLSFTELDKMCNNLLKTNKKTSPVPEPNNLIDTFLTKKQKEIPNEFLHSMEVMKKNFYPSQISTDVECTRMYFSSYDEIFNLKNNQHLEIKCKISNSHHNKNLSRRFSSVPKNESNIVTKRTISENEEEICTENLKKYSTLKRPSVNKDSNTTEALEEEDKMLKAAEEAEKTAEEEDQIMKALVELEDTVVPEETDEDITLRDSNNAIIGSGKISTILSDVNAVGDMSQLSRFSTWNSLENSMTLMASPPNEGVQFNQEISNSELNFGFKTASGLKLVASKEALCKAKEQMEHISVNSNGIFENNLSCDLFTFERTMPEQKLPTKVECKGDEGVTDSDRKNQGAEMKNFPNAYFSTASGSRVPVSEKALVKAREFVSRCEQDEASKHLNETEEPMEFGRMTTSTPKAIHETQDKELNVAGCITNKTGNNQDNQQPLGIDRDLGFRSASGVKVTVSEPALTRAREFMGRCYNEENLEGPSETSKALEPCSLTLSPVPSEMPKINMSSTSLLAIPPDDLVEKTPSPHSGTVRTSFPAEKKDFCFLTASGVRVAVSKTAMTKAKEFVAICDEDEAGRIKNETKRSFAPDSRKTSTPQPHPMRSSYRREKSKSDFPFEMTFTTGLGKKVEVSKEALEKSKKLLSSCNENFIKEEEDNNVEFDGNSDCNASVFTESNEVGLATSGKKSTIESGALDVKGSEGPTFSFEMGFKTCLGRKPDVSEDALEKAKKLMESCNESGHCQSEKLSSDISAVKNTTIQHQPNARASPKRKVRKKFNHPQRLSPQRARNTQVAESKLSEESVEGSIPPEEWDKSFTLDIVDTSREESLEVVKKRKLRLEADNKSNQSTLRSVKRPLEGEWEPQKRKKHSGSVVNTPSSVKDKRLHARECQDKSIKEKQKVKPLVGTHLKKKQTEKQLKLVDAVENSLPVTRQNNNGNWFDVADAIAYKFRGEVLYGYQFMKDAVAVELDDGFELIPNDENNFGIEEVKKSFLAGPGVQPNLVPHGWVENHYKWIVWKLAHYERSFPNYFGRETLTPRNLMSQLKYRYDREIDRNERSALRKILENDDSSAKRIVLRVCEIKKSQGNVGYELNLTDGWYSCPARVDTAMTSLIEKGKIQEGMKLVTQGAILSSSDQGISPLEMTDDVHIKIFTNSTRRAGWDAKMGFQKNPGSILISLHSVVPEGGLIGRIDVLVVRVYPILYSEKTSDGRRVVRNRRGEERADAEYKKILDGRLEKIYLEVMSRVNSDAERNKKASKFLSQDVESESHQSGTNSEEISASLRRRDQLSKEIREKVEEKLKRENLGRRDVSELFKAKVVDLNKPNFDRPSTLSIWSPSEDVVGLFAEGKSVSLMNVTVSNFNKTVNPFQSTPINATRQTTYKSINRSPRYPVRRLTPLNCISASVAPIFREIDLVGIVVLVKDVCHTSTISQIIYLADDDFNFAGLSVWGSYKDYGWEKVLVRRTVVACGNLCWRADARNAWVPVLQAKETTLITENPKTEHMKEGMEKLKKNLPEDINEFLAECEEKLLKKLENANASTDGTKNLIDDYLKSSSNADKSATEKEMDSTSGSGAESNGTRSRQVKQLEKVEKSGKLSGSPFRWLPYKNV